MSALRLERQLYSFKNSSDLEAQLRRQGYSLFSWEDRPGAYYSPHSHEHDEFIVVLSGSIKFTIAGRDYLLEPGDMLTLPAETVHSAVNDEHSSCRYYICTR